MVQRRVRMLCVAVFFFAVFMTSPVLAVPGAKGSPEDLFSGVTTLIAPYTSDSPVSVDGKISVGEYDSSVTYTTSDTGISVWLIHDNDSLFVGIEGPAWRWIAIGISSDEGNSMGFVVVARSGSGSDYVVQERFVSTVSEDMSFTSPGAGHEAVEEFEASVSATDSVAEMQLSLDSSLWSLATGVIYPTVVASNMTAPVGFPTGISGDEAHFAGSYLLRPDDNVKNVNDMLNGKTSPVPSLVAAGLLSIGIVAIFTEFVVRRRKP